MLATCINGVAVTTFVILGAVVWPDALVMIVGALIGGFGGASYARKLDPKFVRGFVIVVGCTMTVIFFFKYGFYRQCFFSTLRERGKKQARQFALVLS